MELFNKYGNSEVQFLLDLFSLPQPFSTEDVKLAVRKNHVYPENWSFSSVMEKWVTMGLFEVTVENTYQIAQNLSSFAAPPDILELSFLQDILTTQETGLFLSNSETANIEDNNSSLFKYIHRINPQGRESELKNQDAGVLRTLLGAIYRKEEVTLTGLQVPEEPLIPYRLEVSVLDGVWRLIGYILATDTVSWISLKDIKSVTIQGTYTVSEEDIQVAISRELTSEFVEVLVRDEKNALDRCFLAFSSMPELEATQWGENKYSLRFRPFQREIPSVLRQLLYLGECVELKSPGKLRNDMIHMLQNSINLQHIQ